MNAAAATAATPCNGARWLTQALEAEGVDTLFGYPGGTIMPFYDALVDSRLKHILVRHEQGAALAANGYARASGRVGVCVATSGPGASNLVTGIADAMLDSVPMVCLTGQVATHLMGTDAFQELDVFGLTLPIVKHSYIVRRVEDLPEVVRDAFRIAREGRPGPVLIDLPKDVQVADASHLPAHVPADVELPPAPAQAALAEALAAIAGAEKPVIYGGGGIGLAGATEVFREFVEATQIPTVLTLRGLGALPGGHPNYLGMLGMHGTRAANMAVQESDLLIVVGARFDDRATGKLSEFAPFARVIHLDADAYEISKLRTANVAVPGDVAAGLRALADACSGGDSMAHESWRKRCRMLGEKHGFRYDAPGADIYAPALLKRMTELAPDDAIVACDVGQHQMWVAQHCRFTHPRNHLTSGALGTMGFGLPAAMGAQFACPDRTVLLVSGDGSFMMNVQELVTIARCRLPVKIVLLDNSSLGMVRQWQELFFAKRYSEIDLSDNPDFAALAEVFGIPARRIERRDQVEDALVDLLAQPGPALLHVAIDVRANVWPLVPPNTANSTMLDNNPADARPAESAMATGRTEPAHALPA
ncbi:MAG: acetolactate synthase 2 catalytic subunit [Lysobacteraceae bacterium]|nr:MAG: acetolactate synthase 2 catalytic subunit [Xanthomonadaceae bacterium]